MEFTDNDNELALKARDGDEQAVGELFSKYKVLVRAISNEYFLVGGEKEDLVAEGMLGLFTAVKNFDPAKNSKFSTFAYLCILRRVISAVRTSGSRQNRPLYNYVPLDNAVAETMIDQYGDPLEAAIFKERQLDLRERIETQLSAFERQVVELFVQGYAYADIASLCGKTPKAVDGALQRARKKLSGELL